MLTEAVKLPMDSAEETEWSKRGQSCLQWIISPVKEEEFLNVRLCSAVLFHASHATPILIDRHAVPHAPKKSRKVPQGSRMLIVI